MADTENVVILNVDTREAVKSIAELKENIKYYKNALNEAEIGSRKYELALKYLTENENALKIAMHATTESMTDVVKGAKGMTESYDTLVNKMAELKKAWRATTDETKRADLGKQIGAINDKLKEMDASVGNYQRNVGNYKSALYGLGDILKGLPPSIGAMKEQAAKLGDTINIIGKQPLMGLVALLAPMIQKITAELKGNKTAMDAIKRLMESLKPVMDMVSKGVEWLAGLLSKAVEWFAKMAGESTGTFKKIIAATVGVGNVIIQYMITPIKTAISAFKGLGNIIGDVFSGNFAKIKEDAAAAFDGIKDAFKNGFSFKENFEKGYAAGEEFAAGLKSSASDVTEAAVEVTTTAGTTAVKAAGDAVKEEVENQIDELQKLLEQGNKIVEAKRKQRADEEKALNDAIVADDKETLAEVEAILNEYDKEQADALKKDEERAKAKKDMLTSVASTTSSILGSIADMYEADGDMSEEETKKVKALRIATATIDTIQGAISAYMGACTALAAVPGLGPAVGAVQAAAVLAAGMAQIKKIQATQVGSSSSSSGSTTSSLSSAMVQAPSALSSIQQVAQLTGAEEESRLNRMTDPQKVYILQSDIEAAQAARKAQVTETSF